MLLHKLQEHNKKLFLELELILANVDGDFSINEEELIHKHCREMGIEPVEYNQEMALENVVKGIEANMTVQEKKIIFIELITVAVIDGVYDSKEEEFVEALRKLLGIPDEVAEQAFGLVKDLIDASSKIENFVEW